MTRINLQKREADRQRSAKVKAVITNHTPVTTTTSFRVNLQPSSQSKFLRNLVLVQSQINKKGKAALMTTTQNIGSVMPNISKNSKIVTH